MPTVLPDAGAASPTLAGSGPAFGEAGPRHPAVHLFRTEVGNHAFVVNGSRLFDVNAVAYEALDDAVTAGGPGVDALLASLGLDAPHFIDDQPVADPPLHALSLAVAQKCNLGCTYCYAQQGDFGGLPKSMPLATALSAVELLFGDVRPGERVNLSFLGGEPLLNREVIWAATEAANRRAAQTGARVTFSITTNATLLEPADGEFFERNGFAVTVSVDGPREVHDRLRPTRSGLGTFDRVMGRVAPLLAAQRRMQVSARVTVTPHNLGLPHTLDTLVGLGFHSVGFSPLLASPTGEGEMGSSDLAAMLEQMVACGQRFEGKVLAGSRYPFANMVNAMRELHRGTHRPYPCGAGAGYLGVSADGDLAACHRFVGDQQGGMGNLATGIDTGRRNLWLAERHVHRQEPCTQCWARYLCSGGCHHEVIHRGRPACDYIRGWLHYCLGAYARLVSARPDYFGSAAPASTATLAPAAPAAPVAAAEARGRR